MSAILDAAAPEIPCGFSTQPEPVDDHALVGRIIAAYKLAADRFPGHGSSPWARIDGDSDEVRRTLQAGDIGLTARILRNPHTVDHFRGYYDLNRPTYEIEKAAGFDYLQAGGQSIWNLLIRLAEAVGIIRLFNPEATPDLNVRNTAIETLLSALDDKFGFRVDFPNPYPFEFGIATSRGIVGHRTLHALYQAWRLHQISNAGAQTRVLEIGAGLGKVAYYARKFGISDYTIVDTPLTNAAQSYFLGRTVGPSKLVLFGEQDRGPKGDKIRIVGPSWLDDCAEHFHVVLNADSMTEMDRDTAIGYFRTISAKADVFISINHEVNGVRVADLPVISGSPARFHRYPYWLRPGYAEEIAYINNSVPADEALKDEMRRTAKMIGDQHREIERLSVHLRSRKFLLRRLFQITRERRRRAPT
jgi:hypothetical protein